MNTDYRNHPDYLAQPTYPGQRIAETPSHDFDYDELPEPDHRGFWAVFLAVAFGALLVAFTVGVICGSVWG